MILKAEPLDPTFKWHSAPRERWAWRSIGIGLLLVMATGTGFYVGRLSPAAPVATDQRSASAGSVAQSQAALQPDAAAAAIRSTATSTDAKPGAKDETTTNATASSTETSKAQSTAATEKRSASPSVVLINPSAADKAVAGDASKQPVSKTELEAAAKANAKTETSKAASDSLPAGTTAKRQVKSQSPARSSASAAPSRQEPVVVRRDDAYVPPRAPQAYADQREGYDDRPRLSERYLDRRYAEDMPPPRTAYEDEYLRPFQGSRDFREYRRFGGYDDGPYPDRRPMLRPMYGARDD